MQRAAAPAQTPSLRRLASAAAGHLSHDLRGCIHVIRGHAELLHAAAPDRLARESATYIVDASRRLGGLCEDVVDFLRLPDIAPADPVPLQVVGLDDAEHPIFVHPVVGRVVSNVLEHAMRAATGAATITAVSSSDNTLVIAIEPVPVSDAERDGVVALATGLLAAHGGDVSINGGRMELLVPIMSEAP